jgi:hypothetical protein
MEILDGRQWKCREREGRAQPQPPLELLDGNTSVCTVGSVLYLHPLLNLYSLYLYLSISLLSLSLSLYLYLEDRPSCRTYSGAD